MTNIDRIDTGNPDVTRIVETRKPKRIRIKNDIPFGYWYTGHEGQEYAVQSVGETVYRVDTNKSVFIEHAEVIEYHEPDRESEIQDLKQTAERLRAFKLPTPMDPKLREISRYAHESLENAARMIETRLDLLSGEMPF